MKNENLHLKKLLQREYLILGAILFSIVILRFPSLFEPFWYGDEGIFAAVARKLNFGGVLYQDAWDNKPPMIYLTYQLIFKFFGVSMFWLRMVTLVFVLSTACVLYEIAKKIFDQKRAFWAAFIFGFLTSLRIMEGNLALTEIFMILPISAAMMISIYRKFDYVSLFIAGFLFSVASLYKQVGAFEAGALGIFLFFHEKNFAEFIKKGLILTAGFAIPYVLTFAYFAPKKLVGEYIFGAYTYYRIYLGESPKYATLINILKYLPIVSAVVYGFYLRRKGNVTITHLILLWTAFAFLGSYFSGRTYGHYLVQATPAISLLLASITMKPKFDHARIKFAVFFFIPLVILTRLLFSDFLSGGPINQAKYWKNFIAYTAGAKNIQEYNDFFDGNVNSIMGLSDFLMTREDGGHSAYIWGDYPWLYAIADINNPVRYVTSFHVFGVPNGKKEVIEKLIANKPRYIIKPPSSIGYFDELETLIVEDYTFVARVENSEVYINKEAIGDAPYQI